MKWPMIPFSEVSEVVTGNTPPKKDLENYGPGTPWVKPPDLDAWHPITETEETLSEVGQRKARLLPPGTVMVCCIGSIGRVGIAGTNIATNQQINSLVFGPLVESRFGYYYCRSIVHIFQAAARQAVVPILNKGNFEKIEMPLPPLSEQLRIVQILDQADTLRKKRTEADTKAERILPALFYKMFGGPATNPKGWDQTPLKELLRDNRGALQSGPFGSNLHNSDFVDEGTVFVVGIDNVHDTGFEIGRNRRITLEKYQELKKYKVEPNDVLITIMGTVGRTCVFPEWVGEAICTKHVYRVQTDQNLLDPEYLCVSIRFSPSVRVQLGSSITGQIVDAITSKDLKELIVDVPPIDLQRQFAHHKKSLDDEAVRREDLEGV
jgi:type I restriction enzyme S subunit